MGQSISLAVVKVTVKTDGDAILGPGELFHHVSRTPRAQQCMSTYVVKAGSVSCVCLRKI